MLSIVINNRLLENKKEMLLHLLSYTLRDSNPRPTD